MCVCVMKGGGGMADLMLNSDTSRTAFCSGGRYRNSGGGGENCSFLAIQKSQNLKSSGRTSHSSGGEGSPQNSTLRGSKVAVNLHFCTRKVKPNTIGSIFIH